MAAMRVALAGLLLATVLGCDAVAPPDVDPGPVDGAIVLGGLVPAAARDRAALPSCGVEQTIRQDGPWNLAARLCFLAAYRSGTPAEFVSVRLTVEGDPVRTVFRVLGPGRNEVLIDSTLDKWSNRTWERATCTSLNVVETGMPSPDFGPADACLARPIG
jgi:hypothetical protein